MRELIRRLFRSDAGGPLEPGPFQVMVLDVLRRRIPAERWTQTDDPFVIRGGGDWRLGLQSLYAEYHRLGLRGAELEEAIVAHFVRTLRNARIPKADLDWVAARDAVRLQLVPAEYRDQAPILSFPFHHAVVIAIAIDMPEGYSLVRLEDAPRWGT